MFGDPQQLRSGEPGEHTEDRAVDRVLGYPAPDKLTTEHRDANERGNGHKHTKAGDLEPADAEQNWIHARPASPPPEAAKISGMTRRLRHCMPHTGCRGCQSARGA